METYLMRQIDSCPTVFHVVQSLCGMLAEAGYRPLAAGETPKPGGKYYLTPHGRSLFAFRLPERQEVTGFMISASHGDSPCFRLRDHAELTGGDYVRLSAERYGGSINDSWLDRPLAIAGRVMVRTGTGLASRLVDLRQDTVLIPRLAIHLNRSVNDGYRYDPAKDLVPLWGAASAAGTLRRRLAEEAGCREEELCASDLMIYNPQPCRVWGPAGEFLSGPRLDDLACVFTCAKAFLEASDGRAVPVLCVYDNEEIGSETKQGAAAPALAALLRRIAGALGRPYEALVQSSLLLSCDNGHARHPNHPELSDPAEAPLPGGGVMIKHSPRYATDGWSAAVFEELCRRANVPVQHYSNRPDQAGGATLGNIADTQVDVATVDIGMAQLAMHSCYETMGTADAAFFTDAVRAFYGAALRVDGDGVEIL